MSSKTRPGSSRIPKPGQHEGHASVAQADSGREDIQKPRSGSLLVSTELPAPQLGPQRKAARHTSAGTSKKGSQPRTITRAQYGSAGPNYGATSSSRASGRSALADVDVNAVQETKSEVEVSTQQRAHSAPAARKLQKPHNATLVRGLPKQKPFAKRQMPKGSSEQEKAMGPGAFGKSPTSAAPCLSEHSACGSNGPGTREETASRSQEGLVKQCHDTRGSVQHSLGPQTPVSANLEEATGLDDWLRRNRLQGVVHTPARQELQELWSRASGHTKEETQEHTGGLECRRGPSAGGQQLDELVLANAHLQNDNAQLVHQLEEMKQRLVQMERITNQSDRGPPGSPLPTWSPHFLQKVEATINMADDARRLSGYCQANHNQTLRELHEAEEQLMVAQEAVQETSPSKDVQLQLLEAQRQVAAAATAAADAARHLEAALAQKQQVQVQMMDLERLMGDLDPSDVSLTELSEKLQVAQRSLYDEQLKQDVVKDALLDRAKLLTLQNQELAQQLQEAQATIRGLKEAVKKNPSGRTPGRGPSSTPLLHQVSMANNIIQDLQREKAELQDQLEAAMKGLQELGSVFMPTPGAPTPGFLPVSPAPATPISTPAGLKQQMAAAHGHLSALKAGQASLQFDLTQAQDALRLLVGAFREAEASEAPCNEHGVCDPRQYPVGLEGVCQVTSVMQGVSPATHGTPHSSPSACWTNENITHAEGSHEVPCESVGQGVQLDNLHVDGRWEKSPLCTTPPPSPAVGGEYGPAQAQLVVPTWEFTSGLERQEDVSQVTNEHHEGKFACPTAGARDVDIDSSSPQAPEISLGLGLLDKSQGSDTPVNIFGRRPKTQGAEEDQWATPGAPEEPISGESSQEFFTPGGIIGSTPMAKVIKAFQKIDVGKMYCDMVNQGLVPRDPDLERDLSPRDRKLIKVGTSAAPEQHNELQPQSGKVDVAKNSLTYGGSFLGLPASGLYSSEASKHEPLGNGTETMPDLLVHEDEEENADRNGDVAAHPEATEGVGANGLTPLGHPSYEGAKEVNREYLVPSHLFTPNVASNTQDTPGPQNSFFNRGGSEVVAYNMLFSPAAGSSQGEENQTALSRPGMDGTSAVEAVDDLEEEGTRNKGTQRPQHLAPALTESPKAGPHVSNPLEGGASPVFNDIANRTSSEWSQQMRGSKSRLSVPDLRRKSLTSPLGSPSPSQKPRRPSILGRSPLRITIPEPLDDPMPLSNRDSRGKQAAGRGDRAGRVLASSPFKDQILGGWDDGPSSDVTRVDYDTPKKRSQSNRDSGEQQVASPYADAMMAALNSPAGSGISAYARSWLNHRLGRHDAQHRSQDLDDVSMAASDQSPVKSLGGFDLGPCSLEGTAVDEPEDLAEIISESPGTPSSFPRTRRRRGLRLGALPLMLSTLDEINTGEPARETEEGVTRSLDIPDDEPMSAVNCIASPLSTYAMHCISLMGTIDVSRQAKVDVNDALLLLTKDQVGRTESPGSTTSSTLGLPSAVEHREPSAIPQESTAGLSPVSLEGPGPDVVLGAHSFARNTTASVEKKVISHDLPVVPLGGEAEGKLEEGFDIRPHNKEQLLSNEQMAKGPEPLPSLRVISRSRLDSLKQGGPIRSASSWGSGVNSPDNSPQARAGAPRRFDMLVTNVVPHSETTSGGRSGCIRRPSLLAVAGRLDAFVWPSDHQADSEAVPANLRAEGSEDAPQVTPEMTSEGSQDDLDETAGIQLAQVSFGPLARPHSVDGSADHVAATGQASVNEGVSPSHESEDFPGFQVAPGQPDRRDKLARTTSNVVDVLASAAQMCDDILNKLKDSRYQRRLSLTPSPQTSSGPWMSKLLNISKIPRHEEGMDSENDHRDLANRAAGQDKAQGPVDSSVTHPLQPLTNQPRSHSNSPVRKAKGPGKMSQSDNNQPSRLAQEGRSRNRGRHFPDEQDLGDENQDNMMAKKTQRELREQELRRKAAAMNIRISPYLPRH